MNYRKTLAALIVALAAFGASAKADFIAYDVLGSTTGNQNFTGAVGMDFNVNGAIKITELGFFDDSHDGLNANHLVSIYNRDTGALLVSAIVPAGTVAPLTNGSRFVAIPAFTLAAGLHLTIVGDTGDLSGKADPIYNAKLNNGVPPSILNDGGGLISFVGTGRYTTTLGAFPNNLDSQPIVNGYAAGTFQFLATVPEPGSIALLGLGGIGLIGLKARRRKAARA